MADESPPPENSLWAGHELRDVRPSLVVMVAVVLVLLGAALHLLLWEVSLQVVPEQRVPGASPPVVMPGEPPVNDRIRSVPQPRLDPLVPLQAEPPSYRPSRPLPDTTSPPVQPQDLWADRQPLLTGYGWVEPGKVARIPIGQAMDIVAGRAKAAAGEGAKK
jgi:hypothetical protein